MNQLVSRSLSNTADCSMNLSIFKVLFTPETFERNVLHVSLPYHPESSPRWTNPHRFEALFDINGQVLNMCLERQAGIQVISPVESR